MAEEVTTELTATQYVILAENQRKKKALADTKTQFNKISEENKALIKQLEDTQRENYEATEHLRRELLQKTERIAELDSEIVKLKEDSAAELKRFEDLAASREANLLAEAHQRQHDLQTQVDALSAKLASVQDFQRRQVEVEEEMLRLKEDNQSLRERLEQQRSELERYYLELNTKMRKEYEQRMEELKKSAEEEIDERMDASVKRILQQNRRMAEELKIHVQETDVLQQEVRILEEERSRLTREVAIKTEMEEGYAKRGAKQQVALKDAQAKIMALEHSLQQIMQDFDRERQNIIRTTQAQVQDANAEAEALRRLVKLKTRELKHIRRLAQEVLLQRSDVETFLLSSLHMARKEIERESVAKPKPTLGGAVVLGGVGSRSRPGSGSNTAAGGAAASGSGAQGNVNAAGRMDIKELPWEDRERVLRLLFAKINNQAAQAYYANLPQHPLGGEASEQQLSGLYTEAGPAGIV